jgi:hypothetical protein
MLALLPAGEPPSSGFPASRLRRLEDITEVTAEAEALLPRRFPGEAFTLR